MPKFYLHQRCRVQYFPRVAIEPLWGRFIINCDETCDLRETPLVYNFSSLGWNVMDLWCLTNLGLSDCDFFTFLIQWWKLQEIRYLLKTVASPQKIESILEFPWGGVLGASLERSKNSFYVSRQNYQINCFSRVLSVLPTRDAMHGWIHYNYAIFTLKSTKTKDLDALVSHERTCKKLYKIE